jgi:uncharacterized membrane protein
MEFMELIAVLVVGLLAFIVIWLIVSAVSARRGIEELSRKVNDLQLQLARLVQETPPSAAPETAPPMTAKTSAAIPARDLPYVPISEPEFSVPKETLSGLPPIIPASPWPAESKSVRPTPSSPPPIPSRPALPKIDWEQFLGVKGLAWVGGLALLLFIAFAIQYTFQHNLIRPEIRMALGFVTGLALLVGGVVLHRRHQYIVGAQTLCAVGIVALYARFIDLSSLDHCRPFC